MIRGFNSFKDERDYYNSKELCELKILELWNHQDNEEFKILCSNYLDISTSLDIEFKTEEYIFEVIKIISFGYLRGRSQFVKDYLNKQKQKIEGLKVSRKWNKRLLIKIFKAIVYIVINNSRNDILKAIELINQLRYEQKKFEEKFLNRLGKDSPFGAAELISLYHFAKTIELLGLYILEPNNYPDIQDKVKYNMRISIEFANDSGDIMLELLYLYIEAFSIKFISDTI
jgi:hypothetical protein